MKIAVIYWSQTGNTQAMAEHILAGLKGAGADADMFSVSEISSLSFFMMSYFIS